MSQWKIYHNPKCSKSRQTLALLQDKGIEPTIIEYLKHPPNPTELREIIDSLGSEAHSIVRTKEDSYREHPFDVSNTETLIERLTSTPKLMERPIVVFDKKAVIGRPPENVKKLFSKD